jgi:hypothetical protein
VDSGRRHAHHGPSLAHYGYLVVVCGANLHFPSKLQPSPHECGYRAVVTAARFMLLLDGKGELRAHPVQRVQGHAAFIARAAAYALLRSIALRRPPAVLTRPKNASQRPTAWLG